MNPLEINLDEIYMTPADTCRLLNLQPHQVKGLVLAKRIGYQTVGGRMLLYRADVDRLVAKGKVTVPAQPDPTEERKKLEATYYVPGNNQFIGGAV